VVFNRSCRLLLPYPGLPPLITAEVFPAPCSWAPDPYAAAPLLAIPATRPTGSRIAGVRRSVCARNFNEVGVCAGSTGTLLK